MVDQVLILAKFSNDGAFLLGSDGMGGRPVDACWRLLVGTSALACSVRGVMLLMGAYSGQRSTAGAVE